MILTETQRRTMVLIQDGFKSQTGIATQFGISSNGAKKILLALKQKGLIDMPPFERNGIQLTEAGKEYLKP